VAAAFPVAFLAFDQSFQSRFLMGTLDGKKLSLSCFGCPMK